MIKTFQTQNMCLLAADLHGNKAHYNTLKEIVLRESISFVFLAGDLLPKDGGLWVLNHTTRTIKTQRDFLENFLIGYLRDLGKYCHVYAIFGNDDFKSNYVLTRNVGKNVLFLNKEVLRLPALNQELFVVGYPWITLTPFLQKDWEQWDNTVGDMPHKIYKTEGYDSDNGKHSPISFTNSAGGRPTIADDLAELKRKSDPKKTLYLMHETPFNTPLDQISPNNPFIKQGFLHVGSRAIRSFIEKEQPLLTMHGHIHETFRESGTFLWNCGKSTSITPSHDYKSEMLCYITFDLNNPRSAMRHCEISVN